MNIGLDLDGTIYNWHRAMYTELVVYWDLDCDYETFWESGFKTYRTPEWWDSIIEVQHLYATQCPSQGLVDWLKEQSKNNTIYYISNRPKCVFDVTKNYLTRWEFPQVENLIFTGDKLAVANSLGIDLFFEDRIHNLEDLISGGINTVAVQQPYNREYLKAHPEIKSVFSVMEMGTL
jgi:uncharacterized HAD superfamily protein